MSRVFPPIIPGDDMVSGAQVVDGSLKFDSSKSQHLKRTPGSAGNRKTWTFSCWVKRGGNYNSRMDVLSTNTATSGNYLSLQFSSGNAISLGYYNGEIFTTSAVYRDFSAWMNIVLALDTTLATAADRVKLYVNGSRVTTFSTNNISSVLTQNSDQGINAVQSHSIGRNDNGANVHFDGSLTNTYLIDGLALGPGYFGYTDQLTGTWRPKKFRAEGTTINNGTTWSNFLTTNAGDNFDASGPKVDAFDGDSTDKCFTANNAAGTTQGTSYIQFNSPVVLRGHIDIYVDNGNAVYSVDSLGGLTLLGKNTSGSDNQRVDLGYVQTSKLRVLMEGGSRPAIGSISVDGVIMVDSTTQNLAYGTNGFHLPFDGSAPIGEDKSGRGNNWTPVNFGGSAALDKATGALPILNTDGGGKVARVGVRTDANASSLVLALPLVGIRSDFSNKVNGGTTEKAITANGDVSASNAQSNFYGGSYYFDGTGDYLTTSSNDYAFGTNDLTVEAWLYPTNVSDYRNFWDCRGTGSIFSIQISNGNFEVRMGSELAITTGSGGSIIANKWTHVALTRSGTTVRLFVDGVLSATGTSSDDITSTSGTIGKTYDNYYYIGYIQDHRVYNGVAKYTSNFIPASTNPDILPDTPSGVSGSSKLTKIIDGAVSFDGSGDKLSVAENVDDFDVSTGDFTFECFTYYTSTGSYTGIFSPQNYSDNGIVIGTFTSGNKLRIVNSTQIDITGTSDISNRWVHIAVTRSGTTLRGFVNGIQEISTTYSNSIDFADGGSAIIGQLTAGSFYFGGFISNARFIKGTALYTENFTPPTAPLTDVTNTKLLCCKSNTSATAFDVSPGTITANGDAAATNFNPFTTDINAVRGQESGYATFNPLDKDTSVTLSDGNLTTTIVNDANACSKGTIAVDSGKWYWENVLINSVGSGFGATKVTNSPAAAFWTPSSGYGYYSEGPAYTRKISGGTQTVYGDSFVVGDVIGVALNLDDSEITFYKNGVSQGVAYSNLESGSYVPAFSSGTNSGTAKCTSNFGQNPFKFPPPAGFQPLNAANVRPSTVIARPDQYVGITTWSGDDTTPRSISSLNFSPDLVLMRPRNLARNNTFYDSVRGAGKKLYADLPDAEDTGTGRGYLSSFDYSGFTLTDGSAGNNDTNNSSYNYVAWTWKAGGNSNTFNIDDVGYATASAAGLTAGTAPSGASVGTKQGFSIIKYNNPDGGTYEVPHGLTETPTFMISKNLDSSANWFVHTSVIDGSVDYGYLNTTGTFNNSARSLTSTTVPMINATGDHIAYIWHSVPGFSKFGSYIGTGVSPNYVHLGFRPALIIIKNAGTNGSPATTNNWLIQDSKRNTYNQINDALFPNTSGTEGSSSSNYGIDFLSNGFALRTTGGYTTNSNNASEGHTFIYAAFAEAPEFNLYGAQSNAR